MFLSGTLLYLFRSWVLSGVVFGLVDVGPSKRKFLHLLFKNKEIQRVRYHKPIPSDSTDNPYTNDVDRKMFHIPYGDSMVTYLECVPKLTLTPNRLSLKVPMISTDVMVLV